MPKTLQMLLARYMNAADGEGSDLPGADHLGDDDYTPGSPEDRGDFLEERDEGAGAPAPAPAPAPAAQEPAAAPAPAEAAAQEEGAGTTVADEGTDGRPSGSVPHARFNEVNQRRKEAERLLEEERAENARLRSQQAAGADAGTGTTQAADTGKPADDAFDFDAKEADYLNALMEGETEKAMKIRREVNTALVEQARSNAKAEARAELQQAEAQRSQRAAMQALAEEAQTVAKAYPYLDTEEGEVAMEMIITRRDSLVAKGMAPHLALREAAALIGPRFAPVGAAAAAGNTPAKDLKAGAAQADSREAAARTRGAQASVAQPPVPAAGMGNRATGTDTSDVALMDDDQFDRLSEAEKRRMRGD